jgi:uncharacterized protein YecT (DUF1311 family)
MKPIVLAAFVLAAGAGAVAAQVSPGPEPTASERAFIASCLAKHTDSASARKACVGVDLGACLGLEDAPKSIKTNGFGHPRDCAAIERQIWDGWLNRWYGEALKKIPAPAVDKLKAAQRAWIAWRDAGCAVDSAVDSALHLWPLGDDNEETCLMEETASRALDLRDIAGDDYEQ